MIFYPKGTEVPELLRCEACSNETHDAYHLATICARGPVGQMFDEYARRFALAEDAAIMGEATQ